MSDVEAGKAHVKTYMDNSLLVKGLKSAETAFQGFGSRLAAIGGKMTGIGDAIGLTVGHEFASKLLKTVAGATLGAAIAAPLGLALGKVFQTGAGATFLVELLKLRDQVSAVLEDVAGALLPPLTAALRVVTGIVSATAGWLASHRQLVVTAAQIASTVFTIGAALATIGKGVEVTGSGFGLLAKIIPAIAGFLASPLGIVVAIAAAIGGAVYAWVKFTASGQAAAKMLLEFFAPAIAFIKQLVGGIGDALMAGDLALAGQIALKGLQIVFVEGLNFIADLIGSTLGDAFGEIATMLGEGNLTGAWQGAIKVMAKLWADFSSGVVKVFTDAAQAVTDKWQKTVNGIANGLLKASAGGGVMGKIASLIVGADVKKLQEENDRIDAKRGIRQDIFGIGSQAVNDHTSGIKASVDDFLKSMNATAQSNAENANHDLKEFVGRGSGIHRGDTGKLQKDFDALTAKAAKERAGIKDVELPKKQDIAAVAVGFSGSALALQLQGGAASPQKQIADAAKKQVELLRDGNKLLEKVTDLLAKFGFK